MDLATFRRAKGLSQEQVAVELGITSRGLICGVENSGRASLRLALAIEKWSGGEVKAATLNDEAARLGATVQAEAVVQGAAA